MAVARNRLLAYLGSAAALVAAVLWWRWPVAVPVDAEAVRRGHLEVSIEELGEARSHDRYTLVAPVAGRLLRIELHEGDAVRAGDPVARLLPAPLDERMTRTLQAQLAAALATQRAAQDQVGRAREALALAEREAQRLAGLALRGLASAQQLDAVQSAVTSARLALAAASHGADAAHADAAAIRATLATAGAGEAPLRSPWVVRAPADGRVLALPDASERVVNAGSALAVIGDLEHLELHVPLLSEDAVRVRPGMRVRVDGWGGDGSLEAVVTGVDAHAFTKVSALGIEEQRVNLTAAFRATPTGLGDGYRVVAHVVVADLADVLRVPISALFACGPRLCVFRASEGRARQREVRIGQRGADAAEVLGGLAAGDLVLVYPPSDLADGARIAVRHEALSAR